MLPKKQSITTRLAFYSKLSDKLDAIGQQLLSTFCNLDPKQAVTVEQLMRQSQVYKSLQFLVDVNQNSHVQQNDLNLEKVRTESLSNLNVYEKYLIEKRTNWTKLNSIRCFFGQLLILLCILMICILVSTICLSPVIRNQLQLFLIYLISSFKQFIGLNSTEMNKNYCNLPVLNGLQSIFLPPFDCDNCVNLTEVAKISNLDHRQFQNSYLNRLIPVVIQDATSQWSALDDFTVDFLKELYIRTEGSLSYHERNCQFFPYKTSYQNLKDAFDNISSNSDHDWYIGWSNCDSKIANILRKYYNRPYFLPSDSLLTKTDWLFMGAIGYGAHMHIDAVGKPSWQAQIKGSKIWTIKPPYECLSKCSTLEVQVEPGEIIVLDTNKWYHKTLIVGNEISITIGSEFD